ncbi:MAG: anaerobic glycerol-3-phosphate dehydrogenase subunit C [Sporomusaceae bacterium]|nr:anaerobic glycerol-3-phosphate dehydrogenase subunit C [Sporomusaceae bacterium]
MKKHPINPDSCTACTVCVAHCPVTAATRTFRGPKMVGPTLERMRLSAEDVEPSLEYCTNCKNCDMSCPSGVPISTLNMLARAKHFKVRKQSKRDYILSHGEQAAKLASVLPFGAAIANFSMSMSRGILKKIGISDKAPLPPYAKTSFMKQFKALRQQSYPDKVVFYPGCFINYNDPGVGMDFVAVMQANNYEVIVASDLVCCGSPLVVNGFLDEAEANARININILKKWTDQGYPVITCCTSCGLMLKQEYQELFHIEGVREYAKHLYDAGEFLLELHEAGRLNTEFGTLNEKYLYHAPCHLRAQGMGLPGLDLLELIPGLEVENADAGCCGISGNYGFKEDKYDIAMKIGAPLFQKIKDSGLSTAVSECGTCRLQIEHGAQVKTLHPMTLLRRAYEAKAK